jgi:hypothetical protein
LVPCHKHAMNSIATWLIADSHKNLSRS